MITKEEYINAKNVMIEYEKQLKEELLNVEKDINTLNVGLPLLKNYIISQPLVNEDTSKGISRRIYNILKKWHKSFKISPEPTVLDLTRISLSKFEKSYGINKKSIDNLKKFAEEMNIKLLP